MFHRLDAPVGPAHPAAAALLRTDASAWIVSDPEGRVLYATDEACRLLGTDAAGLRSASPSPPAARVEPGAVVARTRHHGPGAVSATVVRLPGDGRDVDVRLATRALTPTSLLTVLEPVAGR